MESNDIQIRINLTDLEVKAIAAAAEYFKKARRQLPDFRDHGLTHVLSDLVNKLPMPIVQ